MMKLIPELLLKSGAVPAIVNRGAQLWRAKPDLAIARMGGLGPPPEKFEI
jgi:hypothetical protein